MVRRLSVVYRTHDRVAILECLDLFLGLLQLVRSLVVFLFELVLLSSDTLQLIHNHVAFQVQLTEIFKQCVRISNGSQRSVFSKCFLKRFDSGGSAMCHAVGSEEL